MFDSKNATFDTTDSVAGIDINSGYTGTITQTNGTTITVGTSNYDQATGTFTGGDNTSTVDINGNLIISDADIIIN